MNGGMFTGRRYWTTKTDAHGWVTHTRGACRIVVPPSGTVAWLQAGAIYSKHTDADAAKRAAVRTPGRGW